MKWTERIRKYINKNTFGFLYSRDTLIFLSFCLLSFIFWIFLSQPENPEFAERIPLQYVNVPKNIEIVQRPDFWEVKYKNDGKRFGFKHKHKPLIVDFSDYYAQLQESHWSIDLNERFQHEVDSIFNGKEIISFLPERLEVEKLPDTKTVPVLFDDSNLQINSKYTVGNIQLSPSQLTLIGHEAVLDTIDTIWVRYNRDEVLKKPIEHYAVEPQLPKHTKSDPETLDLSILVEPYTEKSITAPIWVTGLPPSVQVRTIPSEVKITYSVGISRFDKTSASDFVIGITYEELLRSNTRSVFLNVLQQPAGIANLRISPEKVNWMIEVSN